MIRLAALDIAGTTVDEGGAVYRVLADHDLLQGDYTRPEHHFTTTGDPEEFTRLARRFLGPEVISVTGHRDFVGTRGEVVG